MTAEEKVRIDAVFTITMRMAGFVMVHAGIVAVPLALTGHKWPAFVSCVLLRFLVVCSAFLVRGITAFVWVAVALWFASSGFALSWLWGTDYAWLHFFPGLPVPLDMAVDLLPATKKLTAAAHPAS